MINHIFKEYMYLNAIGENPEGQNRRGRGGEGYTSIDTWDASILSLYFHHFRASPAPLLMGDTL
jgi:hypothetical protein